MSYTSSNPLVAAVSGNTVTVTGIGSTILTASHEGNATYLPAALAQLGALALGFAFQLWPALAAICWMPWITRQGATVGAVAGMLGVVFTEQLGGTLCRFLGFELPWGRWPWTIHSAGWGIGLNVVACTVVSWLSHDPVERAHRMRFHALFAATLAIAPGAHATSRALSCCPRSISPSPTRPRAPRPIQPPQLSITFS